MPILKKLEQLLSTFDLRRVGQIERESKRLRFNLTNAPTDPGCVYVWVEVKDTDKSAEVVYVGMAGNTLEKRCNQHKNGFRNSKTGKRHANRIRKGLGNSFRYYVYARKSPLSVVLNVPDVPMQAVEELALIKKFNPDWNKKDRR